MLSNNNEAMLHELLSGGYKTLGSNDNCVKRNCTEPYKDDVPTEIIFIIAIIILRNM